MYNNDMRVFWPELVKLKTKVLVYGVRSVNDYYSVVTHLVEVPHFWMYDNDIVIPQLPKATFVTIRGWTCVIT